MDEFAHMCYLNVWRIPVLVKSVYRFPSLPEPAPTRDLGVKAGKRKCCLPRV